MVYRQQLHRLPAQRQPAVARHRQWQKLLDQAYAGIKRLRIHRDRQSGCADHGQPLIRAVLLLDHPRRVLRFGQSEELPNHPNVDLQLPGRAALVQLGHQCHRYHTGRFIVSGDQRQHLQISALSDSVLFGGITGDPGPAGAWSDRRRDRRRSIGQFHLQFQRFAEPDRIQHQGQRHRTLDFDHSGLT